MRHKAHATDAGTRDRRMRTVDASFARSFDPCSSILTTHGGAKSVIVVGRSVRHHGWAKPAQAGGTNTGAERTDGARLAACHRFRKGESVPRQKRKEVEASVPARTRELGFGCPHVDSCVAEVGRRRLASNKLGKRAPKRAAGSSERGPSSG
jgi:Ni/Co efflux regulator RcnB